MTLDKIFIDGDLIAYYSLMDRHDGDIEYIRKDALLEWAKTEREKCSDETHPYAQFMNVVIDKLNSL